MKDLKISLDKTIAFHPVLAEVFGSIEAAIYFQQLYFWSDKGKRDDDFIYKTKDEIREETKLTRYAQNKCRKHLEELGVLETKLIKANGVPTLHYKINIERMQQLLVEFKSFTAKEPADKEKDFTEKPVRRLADRQLTHSLTVSQPISRPSANHKHKNTTENTTEKKIKDSGSKKQNLQNSNSPSKNFLLEGNSLKKKKVKLPPNVSKRLADYLRATGKFELKEEVKPPAKLVKKAGPNEPYKLLQLFYTLRNERYKKTGEPLVDTELIPKGKELKFAKLLLKRQPLLYWEDVFRNVNQVRDWHCDHCNTLSYFYSHYAADIRKEIVKHFRES